MFRASGAKGQHKLEYSEKTILEKEKRISFHAQPQGKIVTSGRKQDILPMYVLQNL